MFFCVITANREGEGEGDSHREQAFCPSTQNRHPSRREAQVLQLMDKLEPQDLGMKEGDFEGLECSLCIPVVIPDTSTNQEAFEITIFVIPEGGEIPLHDHPNSEFFCFFVLFCLIFPSPSWFSYQARPRSLSPGVV